MRTIIQSIFLIMVTLAASSLVIPVAAGDESSIAASEARRQAQFNLIKAVQTTLTEAGYDPGPVDGLRGPKTDEALAAFQAEAGLEPDGILGPKTLRALGLVE